MKYLFFLILIAAVYSCAGDAPDSSEENEPAEDSLTLDVDAENLDNGGKTVEYHPNGNIKMEGILNENGNREGLWISYYDNGVKWSESYYDDGVRDGHSLTFFPNGQVRYVGEYKNDEKFGTWTFYDEEGNVVNEEIF